MKRKNDIFFGIYSLWNCLVVGVTRRNTSEQLDWNPSLSHTTTPILATEGRRNECDSIDDYPRKNEEPASDVRKGRDSCLSLLYCYSSSCIHFVYRMNLITLFLSLTVIGREHVSHSHVPRYTSGKDPIPVSFELQRKESQLSTKRKTWSQTRGTGIRWMTYVLPMQRRVSLRLR